LLLNKYKFMSKLNVGDIAPDFISINQNGEKIIEKVKTRDHAEQIIEVMNQIN